MADSILALPKSERRKYRKKHLSKTNKLNKNKAFAAKIRRKCFSENAYQFLKMNYSSFEKRIMHDGYFRRRFKK